MDAANWSVPDATDPAPCFRQGDLVRLTWVKPDVVGQENVVRVSALEVRTEIVALLSACCDLVARNPPKRKGLLISPVRAVPKNIAKRPELLAALKASTAEVVQKGLKAPANQFFYAETSGLPEAVIFLESVWSLEFSLLHAGTKVAELMPAARSDLQERIKWHFTRVEE